MEGITMLYTRTKWLVATVAATISLCLAAPATAGEADEASLEILVATIKANKKALVDVNLALEDGEATKFWPIYDRYDGELAEVRERLGSLLADYASNFKTMSDPQATQMAKDYLSLERERTVIREKYLDDLAEALPGRKLARFYQIENKLNAVVRFELARDIPVID